MSYILDALKKAEHERDLGRVPRLESLQDSTPRRSRALPWLIGGILVINLAAVIWWLRPGAPEQALNTAPLVVQPTPVPVPAPAPTPAPTLTPAPTPHSTPAKPAAPPRPAALAPQAAAPDPLASAASIAVTVPAAAAVVTEAPLLQDLPADYRAAVPPLSLDVHVYAPQATARFVLMNMKKYHEGDQLAEGPRLLEITEAGVVMEYRGQMFRIARH